MNRPRRQFPLIVACLFALLGCSASFAQPKEPKPVDPFERTRTRIEQLLKARLNPEPLPAALPNPFVLPASLTALEDDLAPAKPNTPAAPVAQPVEPGSDSEILANFAATLRISGSVQVDGNLNFIINRILYKEGDILLMDKRDPKSIVRILRILPTALTLGFGEATQVIRLRN